MKSELINKLEELIQLTYSEESELMVKAEEYLADPYLVQFLEILANAGQELMKAKSLVEEHGESVSEDDIEELGTLAQALDESGDEILQKQASVIDEILISIGANPKERMAFKKAESEEIDRLRAKLREERGVEAYSAGVEQTKKINETEKAEKLIKENVKEYRPLEGSLSTRYSPDMPGVSLMRVGENVYQCPVTKKIYDFNAGYTTAKGNKIPGTSVAGQTNFNHQVDTEHQMFSTRESILNGS